MKDRFGYTALTQTSDIEVLKILIKYGVQINGKQGHNALENAISCKNLEAVKLLISNGADYKIGRYGETLLMKTVQNELDLVRFLVENGSNLDAQDSTGKTALIYAMEIKTYEREQLEQATLEIVKALIECKANLNLRDKNGRPALWYAYENKKDAIADLLIKNGANAKDVPSNGNGCPIQ